MSPDLDPRIVSPDLLTFLQDCNARVPFHLAGGAALAGAHLKHRLSADADLFVHERESHRELVRALPEVASARNLRLEILRDAATHVRVGLHLPEASIELDIVHEQVRDLEAPTVAVGGLMLESLADLRANKLTCLLSRSEPRDLVDLLFLDRAGFPPERDLSNALKKDAGIDPGVLAWLLKDFPVKPLPVMLVPLTSAELLVFRDDLSERFRRAALPPPG